MAVDKTIKLTQSDDQSITVSSGTDTFTIAFCEVPRVSENAERRFQRIRKPLADVNETKENSPGPYYPFTIYGSPKEGSAKDKKEEKKGSGSHFLAIKDDKAFAICMVGDCKESAFKVKVRIGGVNVLQHTTHGKKSQDYFVVSEQKWVWGKQVGKDTARQFRVFRRGRERLSLRYQLRKNNIKKEVEIEITSRRLARPTEPWSYWPPPRMTLGDEDELIPHPASPPSHPAYQVPTCHYMPSYAPYSYVMPVPQATFQGPTSNDTGPSTLDSCGMVPPAMPSPTASQELALDNMFPPEMYEETMPPPVIPIYQPQPSQHAPTELVAPLPGDDRPSSPLLPEQICQAPTFVGTGSSETTQYFHHIAPMPSYQQVIELVSQSGPPQTSPPTPTERVTLVSSDSRSSSSPPPQHISQTSFLVDPDLITTISYDYEEPIPPELLEFLSQLTPAQASCLRPPEPVPSSLSSPPSPPSLPGPQPPYQAPTCHDSTSSGPYSDAMPTPQTDFQGPTSSDTGPMSPDYTMIPMPCAHRRRGRPPRPSRPSMSRPPCPLGPPEPVINSLSPPLSPPPESAPPKTPNDQESIHSDPEEDMLPHQMVVGTGGLIEQIVHPDKHPEWIDDCTVTLKFKIVDPEYLKKEAGVKKLGILGGNFREVPNPPDGTFRGHAPVVTNPEGLRLDIRSPMEMEMNTGTRDREGKEPPGPESSRLPVDSGVGLVGNQEEGGEEEDVREFRRLKKEAKDQPRGLISDMRMKKTRRKQRKQGGVRIQMVVKPEESKGERKSRWRTFVDAMRRILTLGR